MELWPAQRGRARQRAVAPDELGAVAGGGAQLRARGGERHARGEVAVVGVAREDGAAPGVGLGHHVQPLARARWRERPLLVAEDAQPPGPRARVLERQHLELDRIARRHEHLEPLADAVHLVLEARDAGRVTADEAPALLGAAEWPRRRAPGVPALVVADEDRLRRRVADRVVRERRQPVLAAVLGPGVGGAGGGHERAEAGVGEHVRPRQRRLVVSVEHHHVLAAVLAEAARAVVEAQRRPLAGRLRLGRVRDEALRRPVGLVDRPVELAFEVAVLAAQHGARRRLQQHALGGRQALAAQQEDAARLVLVVGPGAALDQRAELLVHLVEVARGVLVEHRHVRAQALEAPVVLRLQHLPHERQVVLLDHAHDEQRQVARDAVSPEPGLAEQVARAQLARRAQRRVHVEHARGEPFEQLRVLARDAEVAQRHLRVRVPEREGARGRPGVVVLLRERVGGVAVGHDTGRERDAHRAAGPDPDPVAQAHDRVEHRAGRAAERPAVERHGVVHVAPAAEEARAVALPLDGALHAALDAQHVDAVERRVGAAPRPAVGHERIALRQIARGHEQLAERRVRKVVRGRAEHQLGVARDLDLARPRAAVRQRDTAHLHVVLGRYRDLEQRLDAVGLAVEGGLLGQEARDVAVQLLARRLVRGRPDGTAPDVAQVEEDAARVARLVLAQPRDGVAAPERGAAAGVGDDHGVGAVREEVRVRVRGVGRAEAARHHRPLRRRHAGLLGRPRLLDHDAVRHALLQQQLGRLHAAVGVEAPHHGGVAQHVRERAERHALVMSEVGAHHDPATRGRGDERRVALARRVVDRLVVAERTLEPELGETLQVPRRELGVDERGERGRVGRHHQLVPEPALQAQARHAEGLVLVLARAVDDRERRLGDAPGHLAARGVLHLAAHREGAGAVEQRARVASHQQERRQVLEGGRAPREQHRRAVHARERAAEVEPVLLRHLALRDREEAGDARLGGEQVVARDVEPPRPLGVGEAVADREQPALRVVEEAEVHLRDERLGARGERQQAGAQLGVRLADRVGEQRVDVAREIARRDVQRRLRRRAGRRLRRRPAQRRGQAAEQHAAARLGGVQHRLVHLVHHVAQTLVAAVRQLELARRGLERSAQAIRRVAEPRPVGTVLAAVRQPLQPLGDRDQHAREVSAVDSRHVARQQRVERAGVVPVEQMPLVALEAVEGGERLFKA